MFGLRRRWITSLLANQVMLLTVVTAILFSNPVSGAVIELLTNGDFETGSTAGWVSSGSPQWTTLIGPTPKFGIGAADGSYYALPGFRAPSDARTLSQTVDIQPFIGDLVSSDLRVQADAIFSPDAIRFDIQFLDGSNTVISTVNLGTFGGTSTAGNFFVDQTLVIPITTRFITFNATGILLQGSVIDAGFDRASMQIDVVPEPSTALITWTLASVVVGRRQRHNHLQRS